MAGPPTRATREEARGVWTPIQVARDYSMVWGVCGREGAPRLGAGVCSKRRMSLRLRQHGKPEQHATGKPFNVHRFDNNHAIVMDQTTSGFVVKGRIPVVRNALRLSCNAALYKRQVSPSCSSS